MKDSRKSEEMELIKLEQKGGQGDRLRGGRFWASNVKKSYPVKVLKAQTEGNREWGKAP